MRGSFSPQSSDLAAIVSTNPANPLKVYVAQDLLVPVLQELVRNDYECGVTLQQRSVAMSWNYVAVRMT